MSIVVREVTSHRDVREFIRLPYRLHRDDENWLPPLIRDEKEYFDPKRNPAFRYCRVMMALAWDGSMPVGRIMGVINTRHNAARNERTARFSCLETIDDATVSGALLSAFEQWARGEGMDKAIGPFGFTDQDPEGFLVEGYEHLATIATYYNKPYIIEHLARHGYEKEIDWVVYKVDITKPLPDWYLAMHERVRARSSCRLVEFRKRSELKRRMVPLFELMNECFEDIYGYAPLDRAEMEYLTKKYLIALDPRFVKMVYDGDTMVGFFIAMPCLSEGLKRANGRLFPFGVFHILHAYRTAKQLDLLLGGVKKTHQGRGVDILMGVAMVESARKAGMTMTDSHHELETNTKMRAENERLGGVIYKRYRLFRKFLDFRAQ
ncbi:MAG: hypothetical protein QHI48_06635 [Bacteroidota bacterium]|nr:hypothetical protein [Bacteroidota bacterium]